MRLTVGLVYEISDNPHYGKTFVAPQSPLSELVMPSEIDRISQALLKLGHCVEMIDGPCGLIHMANALQKKKSIVIFNKSRGLSGLERKIFVPAICQQYEFPMVGTSAYGVTLARHKYHTNRLLSGCGFDVPAASIYYPDHPFSEIDLKYPVILKPNHESGALGIDENSILYNDRGIVQAIGELHKCFEEPVIVEEYIGGEEWKVAVIGNGPNIKAAGCVGVMKSGESIVDSLQTRDDVLNDRLQYYTPEHGDLVDKALGLAEEIHRTMDCKDYSRCDFRIGKDGKLVCMEVSTQPDLGIKSSFVEAAKQTIKSYELIIAEILGACLYRYSEIKSPV